MNLFPTYTAALVCAALPAVLSLSVLSLTNRSSNAQTTHIVGGPNGLPQIRSALAIAAPGDSIVVWPGTYAHFTVAVGVTIRAQQPGTVAIAFDNAFVAPNCGLACLLTEVTSFVPPPGQEVDVVGLRFEANTGTVLGLPVPHRVLTAGRVSFDDCRFSSSDNALRVTGGAVHLQDCRLDVVTQAGGPTPALVVTGAAVTAVDCRFEGGNTTGMVPPGVGILLDDARLHASDSVVIGGSALTTGMGAEGLVADFDSEVWLADCEVRGGPGACAIAATQPNVTIARTVLIDNGTACYAPQPGVGPLGVDRPLPLAPGTTFSLLFRGPPNTAIGVLAAPTLGTRAAPFLGQPGWLHPGQFQAVAVLVSDTNGEAPVGWAIPSTPGLVGQRLWLQGIGGATFPLATSPVVGGVVR